MQVWTTACRQSIFTVVSDSRLYHVRPVALYGARTSGELRDARVRAAQAMWLIWWQQRLLGFASQWSTKRLLIISQTMTTQ